jgi:hypothetical protein
MIEVPRSTSTGYLLVSEVEKRGNDGRVTDCRETTACGWGVAVVCPDGRKIFRFAARIDAMAD